jgi:hypothetical protein
VVPEKRYRRAVELMEAVLDDELVALDTARGECFGFNGPAAAVWADLAKPRTFAQLRDTLMTRFEVDAATCERDLAELLTDLEERGLVDNEA